MAAVPTYHRFTLGNGLRVVAVQRHNSQRFAASLVIHAGLRNDPPRLDGLAHLVEHLVMAGPNVRIIEDLARRGAYLNGETGWEKTRFSAMAHISLFPDCLGMLANVLTSVACESKAFFNEMQIIKHEYTARACADSYNALFMQRLWGRILGNKRAMRPGWKNVKRLQRNVAEHIEPFHRSFYRPSNGCLAVVSPLDPRELERLLEARLSAKEIAEEPAYPTARPVYAPFRLLSSFGGEMCKPAFNCFIIFTRSNATHCPQLDCSPMFWVAGHTLPFSAPYGKSRGLLTT